MGVRSKSIFLLLMTGTLGFNVLAVNAQYLGPAISSPTQVANAPKAMNVEYDDIKIMPGDVIAIATLDAPELTTSIQAASGSITSAAASTVPGLKVDPRGQIQLPYLGTVVVAGLTSSEVATRLGKALKERGILVDPQVSVVLVDSPTRVITVLGEVQKPMPIPAFGHLRLLDAIAACGGFTPLASHTITVRRLGMDEPITIELGVDPKMANLGDIPLLTGDTVIVPKVGNVFVVGEVKNSLAFPLSTNTPITVMRAISMAGGLKYSAALSRSKIIRTTTDHQRTEIKLDLKKLMDGKQQDVALISDDVLFIPANAFKAIISSGGASVATSLLYGAAVTIK